MLLDILERYDDALKILDELRSSDNQDDEDVIAVAIANLLNPLGEVNVIGDRIVLRTYSLVITLDVTLERR